jgi:hypothetical protein
LRRLVAIDFDHGLRQIVFQIGIDEHEQAALLYLGQKFLGYIVEPRGVVRGGDGELNRQAEGAGQRGRLEDGNFLAGYGG